MTKPSDTQHYDAIIIGAGPAGMMAAIRASERGQQILLIERNESPGRKLLISGKGRCNLTNSGDLKSFLAEFSESRDFLRNSFAQFFNADLMAFFEDAGLKLKTERGGRVFPQSDSSADVLNTLKSKLNNKNIRILSGERVTEILTESSCHSEGTAVTEESTGSTEILHGVYPERNEILHFVQNDKRMVQNDKRKVQNDNRRRAQNDNCRKITGIRTYSGREFLAQHIAITTGGMSYPQTGSTGDGYKLAELLGHRIVALKPALCAVRIKERFTQPLPRNNQNSVTTLHAPSPSTVKDEPGAGAGFIKDWQGIALKNVRLTLLTGDKPVAEQFGEMLFTHFGISGPIVLDLSAAIYDALELKNMGPNNTLPSPSRLSGKVQVAINFKPALDNKILDARLLREFKANSAKGIKNIFKNLMPQGLIVRFLEYCRVDGNKDANQITSQERQRLIDGLFGLRLTVESVMPISEAIVTRGGVATKDINPKTMESRITPGLFFAGEVIDIDAKTGGYNMQAAFSTGWVCGDNI